MFMVRVHEMTIIILIHYNNVSYTKYIITYIYIKNKGIYIYKIRNKGINIYKIYYKYKMNRYIK